MRRFKALRGPAFAAPFGDQLGEFKASVALRFADHGTGCQPHDPLAAGCCLDAAPAGARNHFYARAVLIRRGDHFPGPASGSPLGEGNVANATGPASTLPAVLTAVSRQK